MLNPGFRLLDPDAEQIERLHGLSENTGESQLSWEDSFLAAGLQVQQACLQRLADRLSTPGDHPLREQQACLRTVAEDLGMEPPEYFTYGWPDATLNALFSDFSEPVVLLLGILDGSGIWAGCLAGVSDGGLDFLTTFDFLWSDEPELAAKQSLQDLPDLCQAAKLRFTRPAGGLFIYRDEFTTWRDNGWSREQLEVFLQQATAVEQQP